MIHAGYIPCTRPTARSLTVHGVQSVAVPAPLASAAGHVPSALHTRRVQSVRPVLAACACDPAPTAVTGMAVRITRKPRLDADHGEPRAHSREIELLRRQGHNRAKPL